MKKLKETFALIAGILFLIFLLIIVFGKAAFCFQYAFKPALETPSICLMK